MLKALSLNAKREEGYLAMEDEIESSDVEQIYKSKEDEDWKVKGNYILI